MAKKLQASFTGGELDPKLHARVDLAKYATGAAKLTNWLVHPYGGVSNRPGMEFVGRTVGQSRAVPVRLIPFALSADDTVVLEFGEQYMRVWRRGELILNPPGSQFAGQPFILATPFLAAELSTTVFEQTNDIVRVTSQYHPPININRFANDNWTWSLISTYPQVGPPPFGTVSVETVNRALVSGEYYFPQECKYCVTAVDKDGRESLPSTEIAVQNDLSLRGFYNIVKFGPSPGPVDYYCVYRYKGGALGLVGYVFAPGDPQPTQFQFEDRNQQPDSSKGPPREVNPFPGANSYPRASSQFQQRTVYGGPYLKPNLIRLSQSGDFQNFNTSFPTKDSDAITFAIAGRRRNDVLFFISVEDLIVFTKSGEWRVRGTDEGSLTPASIDVKQQSEYGCSETVAPLLIQSDILFVQAKGQDVLSITYDFATNKYKAQNLSLLARHLFDGRKILEMAYSQQPYSNLYCVMDDGKALAFTYLKEEEVFAWSPIETDGEFESVCVVSEGEEDVPYFVVRRYIGGVLMRTIERFRSRKIKDIRDAFLVDCGLSYDRPFFITAIEANGTIFCPGHPFANGNTVDISDVIGGWTYGIEGERIPYGMAYPDGTPFGGRFQVADVADGKFRIVEVGTLKPIVLAPLIWAGGGKVRAAIQTVNGLTHLNGARVFGLADGQPVGPLTVTAGSVTLPFAASRIHLGLPYTSELETLDLDVGAVELNGEFRNLQKIVVHLDKTKGLFAGNGNGGALYDYQTYAEAGDEDVGGMWTGTYEAKLPGMWDNRGRMRFKANGLPATILAVVPMFEPGGDATQDGGKP
jgi:hypothetical protein